MSRNTVVFDLDGTLIDTAPDIIGATNHTLAAHGFETVASDAIRPVISFGTRAMLTEGLRGQGRAVSEAKLDGMFAELLAYYAEHMDVHSRPFPGMVRVLDELRSRDVAIAICTNKREDMARLLMQKLCFEEYFSAITGRDTFTVCKPDPAHLLGAIRLAQGDPLRSIMVGDSTTDYNTAKAAGVPIIGVTFGYTDVPMADLDCDAVISHYDDFLAAMDGISASRR